MRTMMKVSIPVEAGNKAINDGSLPKIMGSLLERLKPEAAYFGTEHGKRTAFIVFDFNDVTDMPTIAEPLFMGLNADVTYLPVMNATDLQSGLKKLASR